MRLVISRSAVHLGRLWADVTDVTSNILTNTAKKPAAYVEMGLQLAQVQKVERARAQKVERARVHLLLVVMPAPVLDVL